MTKQILLPLAFMAWAISADAQPAFRAVGSIAGQTTATSFAVDVSPSCVTDDIDLVLALVRDVDDTADMSGEAGWSQLSTGCTSACAPNIERGTTASYWLFWRRQTSSSDDGTFARSTSTGDAYALAICYSGAITTEDPFDVIGTWTTQTTDPVSLTGVTTATANALVVAALGGEDNNNASIVTTGTDPSDYTEHYTESMVGADGVVTFSEAVRTAAGDTGTVSVNWNSANPVGSGGVVVALKPPAVTSAVKDVIGNGIVPFAR